jgi:predicted nuclease of predicted toxin-antitoxin system
MRFIVDECTGPKVAKWLQEQNHEVISVYDTMRGADDGTILQKAFNEEYIIITNDKDFGTLVYQQQRSHKGIILLRLVNEKSENKIAVLREILDKHADRLSNHFIVASEKLIRIS